MRIIFTILRYELGDYQSCNKEIVAAIEDLVVNNEIYTRITKNSKYNEGIKKFKFIKKQIYPYFLMYQGADREELVSFMMRDQMPFDIDKYPIEKNLQKLDLKGFIDYICENQNRIIKLRDINS